MSEELLKIDNLVKSFYGIRAVDNVSLTIKKGEIHCLAGENGCGKSTIIKMISGVYKPDSGTIKINGHVYSSLTPIDAIREGIQVIYQDFSVFPNLTVAENIALNYELSQNTKVVNWKSINKIAEDAMKKININIDLNKRVEDLSVADRQLIAISRALIQNAKLIIMDEPTTALTRKEINSLFKIIKSLQEKGISILFVSHKLDEVFEISETITILRNGKHVISGDKNEFNQSNFVYYMTGKEINDDTHKSSVKNEKKTLLKIENLNNKKYFENISFMLKSGEILGITGLLGSGRTELAMSLFGLKNIDSGKIYINDSLVKIKTVQDAIKNRVAYVPEDRLTEGLFLEKSVGDNIISATIDRDLKKLKIVDKKKKKEQIVNWITNLGVKTSSPDLPIKNLSGGNQQKVVLAKWLLTDPLILILNGPTVGVDIGSKNEIYKILGSLAESGMGIIIISDDIPEIMNNCDRILLMKNKKIVKEYTPNNIGETELTRELNS